MRYIRLLMAGSLTAFFLSNAYAAQIRIAQGDAEISAVISANEVSRISLTGDRISSVVRTPAGYQLEHDSQIGDIYLVPLPGVPIDKIVNLFITSEKGYSYQLLLTPRDIPSEQIIIRGPKPPLNRPPLTATSRLRNISSLIRAMYIGELTDEYQRIAPHPAQLHTGFAGNPHIIETWDGEKFRGLKIAIDRESNIDPSVIAPNAAAVWVSPLPLNDTRQIIFIIEEVSDE